MTLDIQADLTRVLEAVTITSPAMFLFRGETINVSPGPVQPIPGFPNHPLPQLPLARDLQAVLYSRCYAQRIEDQTPASPAAPFTPDPSFVPALSRANRSQPRWEGGWSVYAIGQGGQVSLQKGDRQRFAFPGEFLSQGPPGLPPQPGTAVSVYAPRESNATQPGFYFAFGEMLSDIWDEHNLLRFYFHAPSDVAADLLAYLTGALNKRLAPFKIKVLNEPALFPRTDAVVLYLAKRYYELTVRLIREMPQALAGTLRRSTPLFTLPIQPGVGMAEDPNTGESFGMNRCRMTAEGIVEACRNGEASITARMKSIAARFAQEGYSLELPYLNPGSRPLPEVPTEIAFAYA
jgi:hypothetical protein